jgi:hypothetical protein
LQELFNKKQKELEEAKKVVDEKDRIINNLK